jgi:signal transduction histidine kinase
MPDTLDERALRALLDAGRGLVGELELDAVLDRLLGAAAELTGARNATLDVRDAGHPSEKPVLCVPIHIRGEVWGNLYLADKPGGEPFSQADGDAMAVLAGWAAVAIANALTFQDSERRRAELEASAAITVAVGAGSDPQHVLELIVGRGRDLVGADGVAILLRGASGLRVAAEAGAVPALVRAAPALSECLLVPLIYQGRSLGLLAAFGRRTGGDGEQLLRAFAASAATAVVQARSVEERRLHVALEAAEAERARWARELHDEPLQGLGALRLLLVGARRTGDPERVAAAVDGAIERLEGEIDALRGLVRELRPAALDELGLGPALEGLAERAGMPVEVEVRLGERRLPADLEIAAYRIAQEALNNALRHAAANAVAISVHEEDGTVRVEVSDDGRGFDPDAPAVGFGLRGMRERVELVGGELEVESSAAGTRITATLPELSR